MITITSCSKQNPEPAAPQTKPSTEALEILSFASEDEMLQQSYKLLDASSEERANWYKDNGNFLAQNDFRWLVVDELSKVKSLKEVFAIHAKYENLLLFNYTEENENISPYLPSDHMSLNLVCNKYGNVLINGEVRNYNDLKKVNSTPIRTGYKILKSVESLKSDKRYFWAEYNLLEGTNKIYLRLGAERKFWVGWLSYRTVYSMYCTRRGDWESTSDMGTKVIATFNDHPSVQHQSSYSTGDIPSYDYHYLGARKKDLMGNITGSSPEIEIWTRGVGSGRSETL